jgi:hypothetical protein
MLAPIPPLAYPSNWAAVIAKPVFAAGAAQDRANAF